MKTLRLLVFIEANTITGPAKNLLTFAEMARLGTADPHFQLSIGVFQRPHSPEVFVKAARRSEIPIHIIPETGRFDFSVLDQMRSLAREFAPDLVQSHAVKSHLLVRRSRLNKIAPWIAFHHGYTWTDAKMRLYNQLDRWSLRAADRIVTVSQPFRDQLMRIGVDEARIRVLHNAVNPEWSSQHRSPEARSALRKRLGIGPDQRIVLIVGRLSQEKDHQTALRAFRLLARKSSGKQLPPLHLLIVGEGPERARIEEASRRFQLSQCVTLLGQVPSAEPYYGIADVSVLSSLTEGSPNALLESMAARVPVIATSVGGVPEIVSHNESALLIKTHDPAAMASSIEAILADETLRRRLTERAYELVLTRFTPEARMRQLTTLYQSVLM